MAKLRFPFILWMHDWPEWMKAIAYTWKIMSYIMLVDTGGGGGGDDNKLSSWDEKIQRLGSLERDNILILFLRNFQLQNKSKMQNNAVVFWNVLTNLGP